jgi:NAD(P)-dependent dehydrogenase (short-subunit alcohol dehydrogenase family)
MATGPFFMSQAALGRAVRSLASDPASYVNGQVWAVKGGIYT